MLRDPLTVRIERRLRLVAILQAARDSGLTPLHILDLHAIAYFADALAPVWGLRIAEAQLLKRVDGPTSPALQGALDDLVGSGVVLPRKLGHVEMSGGGWRLDAAYELNYDLAGPILEAARGYPSTLKQIDFAREVVFALSALGHTKQTAASRADAAYSDPVVDFGGLLDLAADDGRPNRTARVAMRFRDLTRADFLMSDSEMVHLYVRALYERLSVAS